VNDKPSINDYDLSATDHYRVLKNWLERMESIGMYTTKDEKRLSEHIDALRFAIETVEACYDL